MAENFYTMLTIVGKNKLSSSAVSGSKVNFKTLKVGDGKGAYYEPSENQTSLMNKVWEGNISSISIDENNSNWIVVETVIPASDGGFFIREAGIFDEDGDMIAISKLAETYKPVVAEGSTKDLVIRIVLEVLNVDTVTIKIDPNVVAATKSDVQVLEAKFEAVSEQLSDLAKSISNDAVLAQTVSYGMNNKITNSSAISNIPKFTIQGKTLINLLGKDGNCEDLSKWGLWQATGALDSTNKVFGSNGFKLTLTSTVGTLNKYLGSPNNLDITKYYLVSAYLKNGNATSVKLEKDGQGGGIDVATVAVTDTTKFTRVGIVVKPTDSASGNYIEITINGASGQYAYVDGIMINEITASEYALGADALLAKYPYVDSYTCLQNPYIEVRHDNLVRNGNGEEGIAWWYDNQQQGDSFDGAYFNVFSNVADNSARFMTQSIPVKANTSYSFSAISKAGTDNAEIILRCCDKYGNNITSTGSDPLDTKITNTMDTNVTGTIVTPSNAYSVVIYLIAYSTSASVGKSYFKNIMLVEGTTAATEYKSCLIEKVVLETKLTSDDSITYENGEVTGLINWKHKTLYGKDYDWTFSSDGTGWKTVKMPYSSIPNGVNNSEIATKYDGKILKNVMVTGGWNNSDISQYYSDYTGIAIADSDSGWTESINPNNDEVKAFMNGWKAMYYIGSRYVAWRSIIDGSFPSGITSTTTGSASSATTTMTVSNGSLFTTGDYVLFLAQDGATYNFVNVTVSGNTLTLGNACTWLNGTTVIRADNGSTNTSLLNWCKNNIAPNYDGYQLHYKLANPEPITDDNCHIHGDIPKFDVGDNYLFLDSGRVLGEVANPVYDGSVYYHINAWNTAGTQFKNRVEQLNSIYKNNIYDMNNWSSVQDSLAYGNYRYRALTTNYNSSATYTVDYKILAIQAQQIGLIGCSYSHDISNAINNLQEDVNNRQEHDSILDEIVDLSLYETGVLGAVVNRAIRSASYGANTGAMSFWISFQAVKKSIPTIKINNLIVYVRDDAGNSSIVTPLLCYPNIIRKNGFFMTVWFSAGTIATQAINNGCAFEGNWVADCQGRI